MTRLYYRERVLGRETADLGSGVPAAIAAILSLLFAAVVARRWAVSRRSAFAAWSLGLLIFAAAAAFQATGQRFGFSAVTFRGFYLCGGVLGVAWLAQGTVFLLAPRPVATWAAWVLAGVTVGLALDAAVIPVDTGQLVTPAGVLGRAIVGHGNPLYVGAVVLNILGTLVLVGGSAWSAWRLARDRAGLDRVICNVLLTAGALVVATGFSAAKTVGVAGAMDGLGVAEAVGIGVMFAGFLALGRIPRRAARAGTLRAAGTVIVGVPADGRQREHAGEFHR